MRNLALLPITQEERDTTLRDYSGLIDQHGIDEVIRVIEAQERIGDLRPIVLREYREKMLKDAKDDGK